MNDKLLADLTQYKFVVSGSILIAMIGAIVWITQIYFLTEATAKDLVELRSSMQRIERTYAERNLQNQKEIFNVLQQINYRSVH